MFHAFFIVICKKCLIKLTKNDRLYAQKTTDRVVAVVKSER